MDSLDPFFHCLGHMHLSPHLTIESMIASLSRTTFLCYTCSCVFPTDLALLLHCLIYDHLNPGRIYCTPCGKFFEYTTNLAHALMHHPHLYCPGCEEDLPTITVLRHVLNPLPHGVPDMHKFISILPKHMHETVRKGRQEYLFTTHSSLESNPLRLQTTQFRLRRVLDNPEEFTAFLDAEPFHYWPRQIHQVITSNLPSTDASNLASLLEGLEQNRCLAEITPLLRFYEFQILQISLWQSGNLQLSFNSKYKDTDLPQLMFGPTVQTTADVFLSAATVFDPLDLRMIYNWDQVYAVIIGMTHCIKLGSNPTLYPYALNLSPETATLFPTCLYPRLGCGFECGRLNLAGGFSTKIFQQNSYFSHVLQILLNIPPTQVCVLEFDVSAALHTVPHHLQCATFRLEIREMAIAYFATLAEILDLVKTRNGAVPPVLVIGQLPFSLQSATLKALIQMWKTASMACARMGVVFQIPTICPSEIVGLGLAHRPPQLGPKEAVFDRVTKMYSVQTLNQIRVLIENSIEKYKQVDSILRY